MRVHCLRVGSAAMAGVAAIRHRTSLREETLDHESAGRWAEALTCYSLSLQSSPDELMYHQGIDKNSGRRWLWAQARPSLGCAALCCAGVSCWCSFSSP
jgi:hypothetical protein